MAEFLTNLVLSINVLSALLSHILIMTNPDISSMIGVSILVNLCSLGFNITYSFGKKFISLSKKLKHDSLESIIPSNSNMLLISRTDSTCPCISHTKVNISNL